ncbi:hypothetical protein [Ruminococcus flavefaciens]|uniref:hypothetical protein n=1 Tax=Ruminococcus flavefaciens TaxID=1265 RepID=UPI0026EB4C20|nr:hypothetical protein [Ruminococcus flavefaciens]
MDNLRIAIQGTVNALNGAKITFGTYTFSLWQMIMAFASLSLLMWFLHNVFTKD